MYKFEAPLKIIRSFENTVRNPAFKDHYLYEALEYPSRPQGRATLLFSLRKMDRTDQATFLQHMRKRYPNAKIK